MNRLSILPRGFGNFPALEILDLTYNNLSERSLPGNFFFICEYFPILPYSSYRPQYHSRPPYRIPSSDPSCSLSGWQWLRNASGRRLEHAQSTDSRIERQRSPHSSEGIGTTQSIEGTPHPGLVFRINWWFCVCANAVNEIKGTVGIDKWHFHCR